MTASSVARRARSDGDARARGASRASNGSDALAATQLCGRPRRPRETVTVGGVERWRREAGGARRRAAHERRARSMEQVGVSTPAHPSLTSKMRPRRAWACLACLLACGAEARRLGKGKSKLGEYPARPATDGRRLFLLFTTQRSGSTWACQLLSAQAGLSCGTPSDTSVTGGVEEMLIRFTTDRFGRLSFDDERPAREGASVAFDEWRDAADAAFDAVAGASPAGGAVGYKLMYNQVPAHLLKEFGKWVLQRRICVVHLVREATVLRLASIQQSNRQQEMHVTDPEKAKALAVTSPLHLANVDDVAKQARPRRAPRATRRRAPSPPRALSRALSPGAAARAGRHRVARPPHAQGRGARPPRAFFRARARRRAEAEALSISLPLSARCAITT